MPKSQKIEIGSTARAIAKNMERLNAEWEYFKRTGKCPKCQAQILGRTPAYDLEHRGSKILQCRQCSKIIQENGGSHLKRVRATPISERVIDVSADYFFQESSNSRYGARSRRKSPVCI